MKLTTYIYKGPRSSSTLRVDNEVLEVHLNPGKPVNLPAEHEYTRVLLELKHLEPAPAEQASAQKKGGK
ncbi:hypothetical protein [Pseudomonas putida]|uniref:hypothetical protein n=1 Tax=Pseudomonas putida TaxID=303 RepID=UPI0035A428F2